MPVLKSLPSISVPMVVSTIFLVRMSALWPVATYIINLHSCL